MVFDLKDVPISKQVAIWDLPVIIAATFVAQDKSDCLTMVEPESHICALQLLELLFGQEDLFDAVAPLGQGTRSQRDYHFCQHSQLIDSFVSLVYLLLEIRWHARLYTFHLEVQLSYLCFIDSNLILVY